MFIKKEPGSITIKIDRPGLAAAFFTTLMSVKFSDNTSIDKLLSPIYNELLDALVDLLKQNSLYPEEYYTNMVNEVYKNIILEEIRFYIREDESRLHKLNEILTLAFNPVRPPDDIHF